MLRQSVARLESGMGRRPGAAGERFALGPAPADDCLAGGLRRAALHEVFTAREADGPAASGFAGLLAGLAAQGGAPLVWIRQDLAALEWGELHAPGLAELGLRPDRFVLVKVGHAADGLKAAFEALQCRGLGAVVLEIWGEAGVFDLTASRRLVLAAGRSGVTAIALRLAAAPRPSAAETRWLLKAAPSGSDAIGGLGCPAFDAALVRSRKGGTGQWIMEWNSDACLFRVPAHSGPGPAATRHRPARSPAVGIDPIRQVG